MLRAARLIRAAAGVASTSGRASSFSPTRSAPPPRSRRARPRAHRRVASATMATRLPEEDDALRARKKATRAEVRAALRAMSEEEMASQSAAIGRAVVETLAAFRAPAASATAARPVRLGLYVHCAKLREVDTTPLLDAALALRHAEVYVPIVDPPGAGDDAAPSMRFLRVRSLARDLEPKTMGILEPKEFLDDGVTPRENLEDAGFDPPLDVLLMPGLAFETSGARLGRGGGFYDAFLERYRRGCRRAGANPPPTLALAFAPQVLAPGAVPAAAHDQPVDALATPGGIVACTNAGRRLVEGG